jgi:hypothetical protein
VAPTLPSNLPIPYVAITPSYYIPLPTGSILW